jgi:rod shape-determining protein MreD
MIAAYILICLLFANVAGGSTQVQVVVPQIALSVLCYPLVDRLVAWLDRLRLTPFVEIR